MSSPTSSGSDRAYRPDIDGIRSIAVLSVVFFHAGVPLLTGGFTGVDIFFVISGYLIGGHIFSELSAGSFSFLRFYQRRAKRILPAFYGVLLFTIVAAMLLMSPHEAATYGLTAVAATLSMANMAFWYNTNYFQTYTNLYPLLNTWSLGVEEQFYLVIPLLMVLLARVRRNLVLSAILVVCILSFLLAWHELVLYPKNVFYLLPERAWELGVGVALGVFELTRKPLSLPAPLTHLAGTVGVILIVAPMFLLNARSVFPGPGALASVLGTALIIAVPGCWINRWVLSLPPLVFIGRISYSLYLWHWPLLSFLRLASGDRLPPWAASLAVAASLTASILSYYVIEQPFRRSTRPPRPLLIRYAIVSLFIVAISAGVWLSGGVPQRFPQVAQFDYASQSLKRASCMGASDKLILSPPCYDASDQRPAVALWGDSHSAALAPGMRSLANSQGYGFIQLSGPGCAPLTGAANYLPDNPHAVLDCLEYNRRALEFLKANTHVRIVFLIGSWAASFHLDPVDRWLVTGPAHERDVPTLDREESLFRESLAATIQGLQQAGKQVVVMKDVPLFDSDPLMQIRTARIPARRMLAQWMQSTDANDTGFAPLGFTASVNIANTQLETVVSRFDGKNVKIIDLSPEFCQKSGGQCAYRLGDRLLYCDVQHLTPDGAQYALRDYRIPALPPPSN